MMFNIQSRTKKRVFIIFNMIYLLLIGTIISIGNAETPSLEGVRGDEFVYTIALDDENAPLSLSTETFESGTGTARYVSFDYSSAKRATGVHVALAAGGSISNSPSTQITSMKTLTAIFEGSTANLISGPSVSTMGNSQAITSGVEVVFPDNPYFFSLTNSGVGDLSLTSLEITYSCAPYYATISYDTNGGSSITPTTQAIGSAITAPTSPTKPGYTFQDWYSDSALTSQYTFTTMPDHNITLYAKWTANTYTITMDVNGGSMRDATTYLATFGQAYALPVPAPAEGDFVGWYLGEVQYTDEFGASLQNYSDTSDITLVATYVITFIDIANASQLDDIRNDLSANYRLVADIDLTGVSWSPIGDVNTPFTGIFDGQEHTISNLTISDSYLNDGVYYGGLFGYAEGNIRNVSLLNVSINLIEWSSTRIYVGALCGYSKGSFENVHITSGTLFARMISSIDGYAGGVVGYLNDPTSSFESVTNNATITSEGITYTGGIVGYALSSTISMVDVYNTGNVTSQGKAGGLIGYTQFSPVTLSGCKNEGAIDGANYTGGLIGHAASNTTITNSQNYGEVSGSLYAGGLMGYSTPTSTITNVHNYADVSAANYAGGFIGNGEGATITNSANLCSLVLASQCVGGLIGYGGSNIYSSYNTSDLSGGTYIGGLIGRVNSNMVINDSYNVGYIGGGTSVGGLVGYVQAWNFTMNDSYNGGTVHATTNYVGGLVGNADATWGNLYIYTSVNFGDVIINVTTSNIGGIISGTPPTYEITDNYYYCDITSNSIAVAGTVHGTKVTDVSTFSQAFFTTTLGWSDEVWNFTGLDVALGMYPTHSS